jgi:hypothetical protein
LIFREHEGVIGILGWDSTFTLGVLSVDLESYGQVSTDIGVQEQERVKQQIVVLNENISAIEGGTSQSRVEVECRVVHDENAVDLFIKDGGFKNPAMNHSLEIGIVSGKTLSDVEIEIQGL